VKCIAKDHLESSEEGLKWPYSDMKIAIIKVLLTWKLFQYEQPTGTSSAGPTSVIKLITAILCAIDI